MCRQCTEEVSRGRVFEKGLGTKVFKEVRSTRIPHSSPPIPHLRRASVKRSVVVSYLRKCDGNVRGTYKESI